MDAPHYGYRWDERVEPSHQYLLPKLMEILNAYCLPGGRVLDVGAGNGQLTSVVASSGYAVTALEPSGEGVAAARRSFPDLDIRQGSADPETIGPDWSFDLVYSLEVVEHVFLPRIYADYLFRSVKPGGIVVLSTPYHGYLKNLAIALTGRFDAHVNPLWDYGHIKFWSEKSLSQLLTDAGFAEVTFDHVGRLRPLAKSMFAIARRPAHSVTRV